jgi:hypothetical protein
MEAACVYAIYLLLAYCTCITLSGIKPPFANLVIVASISYIGIVTINSPGINTEVAPVCSGDELELICTVPGRVLEWTVSLMPPSEDMIFEYPLTSVEQPHTIIVNGSTSFTFSRISPQYSHPLISR